MIERKTFYRVGEFIKTQGRGSFPKIIEKEATVQNNIARFREYDHQDIDTLVLASSLAWSAEEACDLYLMQKQMRVEQCKHELEVAEKQVKKAEGLYERWLKEQEAERLEEQRRVERERARLNEQRENQYRDKP
jgi:hypothetical protein